MTGLNQKTNSWWPAFIIGHLFFLVLFIFSWIFYKERLLNYDPAFYLFKILQFKDYNVEINRYGGVLSQILPLWLIKNGADLKTITRAYSVSFILVYYFIYIATLFYRNYKVTFALLLSLCLGYRHVFYYSNTELTIGLAFCFILWASIIQTINSQTKKQQSIHLIISALLIISTSLCHPLLIIGVMFVLLIELINSKMYFNKLLWTLIIFSIAWFGYKILSSDSAYENDRIPSFKIFFEKLNELRKLPSYNYLIDYFNTYGISLYLTWFISTLVLFKNKKWILGLAETIFIIVFLIIIIIINHAGNSAHMYETYYTFLGAFAGIIFVIAFHERLSKALYLLTICSLLVINLQGIYKAHYVYTKRVDYLKRLTDYGNKNNIRKMAINTSCFPWNYGWATWSIPFESLILSSLNSPDSAVTVFPTDNYSKYDTLYNKKNVLLGADWAITWFSSDQLDRNYYRLPESGYKLVNSSQNDSAFVDSVFNTSNLLLQATSRIIYADATKQVIAPIKIINTSGHILNSSPRSVYTTWLAYHIYDNNGKLINYDGRRTPFEVDIENEYIQGILIDNPEEKGEYIIEVDVLTENKRWWGINEKIILIVK